MDPFREVEETPDQVRRRRAAVDRIRHEFRYNRLISLSTTYQAVIRMGEVAGRWGKWRNKCPVRGDQSLLRGAWLYGWQKGREVFEKLRDKPKPPSGPNGGRRLRLTA